MSGTRKRLSPRARRELELYDEAMAARCFTREPRTLAHSADPETSKESAAASQMVKGAHRRACLEAHDRGWSRAGLTDDEVAIETGFEVIEARRRCSDLRRLGLIEWRMHAGKPVFGKTAHGKRARVSVITPAGRAALRA